MDKQIIIEIKGGVVEAVTTNFDCKYMVLDYDNSDIEYTIYEPDEILLDQDIFEV